MGCGANHDSSAGSGCHGPTRAGETPEPAKQRAFAGPRRDLLFENRMQKCATRLAPLFLRSPYKLTSLFSFTFDSSETKRMGLLVSHWRSIIKTIQHSPRDPRRKRMLPELSSLVLILPVDVEVARI
jgi:hypothetical protein